MDIDLNQLPIPDWGLACPQCGYPLRGLPSHRCPECGTEFDVPSMIRPWTRLRDPRYHGDELPVPDFGLRCGGCHGPLAGATSPACPHCRRPFDLPGLRPPGAWFVLDRTIAGPLPMAGVISLLASEAVPYLPAQEKSLAEIYAGQNILVERVRLPSEFFFDVLWLLRRARVELAYQRAVGGRYDWRCPQCREENPGSFDVCWNCGGVRGGSNSAERGR